MGVWPIRRIVGSLNAAKYQQEVVHDIDAVCRNLAADNVPLIFQQDLAPAHNAKSTLAHFQRLGVRVLDWPGNSPDLNPIEHVWAYVSRILSRFPRPNSSEQYWQQIQRAWHMVPVDFLHKLYDSMTSRLKAVRSVRGRPTRY